MGDTMTTLRKNSGYCYLAWQGGHGWSKWHIAQLKNLGTTMCGASANKGDIVNTTNRAKLSEVCFNCMVNLRKML